MGADLAKKAKRAKKVMKAKPPKRGIHKATIRKPNRGRIYGSRKSFKGLSEGPPWLISSHILRQNEAMPGLIKIGCTNGELASRIRQLYSTGVPLPFELFYACEVSNCAVVEDKLHDAFGDHRVSKGREFFRTI